MEDQEKEKDLLLAMIMGIDQKIDAILKFLNMSLPEKNEIIKKVKTWLKTSKGK